MTRNHSSLVPCTLAAQDVELGHFDPELNSLACKHLLGWIEKDSPYRDDEESDIAMRAPSLVPPGTDWNPDPQYPDFVNDMNCAMNLLEAVKPLDFSWMAFSARSYIACRMRFTYRGGWHGQHIESQAATLPLAITRACLMLSCILGAHMPVLDARLNEPSAIFYNFFLTHQTLSFRHQRNPMVPRPRPTTNVTSDANNGSRSFGPVGDAILAEAQQRAAADVTCHADEVIRAIMSGPLGAGEYPFAPAPASPSPTTDGLVRRLEGRPQGATVAVGNNAIAEALASSQASSLGSGLFDGMGIVSRRFGQRGNR